MFCLAAYYLMLFNPRTENNSYAVLAPVIALLAADAFLVRKQWWIGWLCVLMAMVLALAWETAALLHVSKDVVSPTVAMLSLIFLAGVLRRGWGKVNPGDCACSS